LRQRSGTKSAKMTEFSRRTRPQTYHPRGGNHRGWLLVGMKHWSRASRFAVGGGPSGRVAQSCPSLQLRGRKGRGAANPIHPPYISRTYGNYTVIWRPTLNQWRTFFSGRGIFIPTTRQRVENARRPSQTAVVALGGMLLTCFNRLSA